MSAILKPKDLDILRRFIPLNTLSDERFQELIDGLSLEQVAKGSVVFDQGDEKKEFIYLISGSIALYAGQMEMESIATGSEAARFAIAHQLPRKVKGVAKTKLRIVRVPSNKLDQGKAKEVSSTYTVDEPSSEGGDWMATMLQSPVFQRLPAANLQKVMMKMEEVAFQPGETVVKQGDPADYYYIIKRGTCELTRQSSKSAKPIKLAELHDCASFGEDALLSDAPRNVTVTMKGEGQLLRLTKDDFITLVKEPVLQYLEYADAEKQAKEGAAWLDVREVDAYQNGHIDDSINIPFFSLRMKVSSLKHDQVQLLVCEEGRTSEAAAFLLLKFGFNAYILKGGMESLANAKKQDVEVESQTSHDTAPLVVEESGDEPLKEVSQVDLLEEARQQIANLEKLCAAINEEQNKISLERDAIQKDRDHQLELATVSQSSIALYKEQLETLETSQLKFKTTSENELKTVQKRVLELEALEGRFAKDQQQLKQVEQEKATIAEALQNERNKLAGVENDLLGNVAGMEDLQKQYEELQHLLTTKDEQIEQQNNELTKVQQNVLNTEQEVVERVSLVEEEREQLKIEKAALAAEIQPINEKLTVLETENSDLKEALDSIDNSEADVNEKLKSEIETLTFAKQQVDQLITELEDRYQTVYEESGTLKQELASQQKLLDEQAQETNGLQDQLIKVEELEKTNAIKLQDLSGKNKDLYVENKLLLEQSEQQQKTLSEVQAELINSQQKQSVQKEEHEVLVHELDNMDLALSTDYKEHAEALAERDRLSKELERLKSDEEESKRTAEKLNQANDDLQKELESSLAATVQAQAEIESVRGSHVELKGELDRLKGAEEESKCTAEKLNQSNNDLQQELESAQTVIEGIQAEIESVRVSNVSLKDELASSQQLLQDSQGTMEMLAVDKQSMEDSLKQQLTEIENQLILEKETASGAKKLLDEATSDVQNSSYSMQQLTDKIQQLSDEKEADMEKLSSLQESLTILEASLESSKEEKEKLELGLIEAKEATSMEANKIIALEGQLTEEKLTIEENVKLLTLSLQASQKEVGDLSLKLDSLLDVKAVVENENGSLEQKVALYEQNKQALTENIKMLESKLSQPEEKEESLVKIQSLEKQLNDARTALMDKEVELANIDSAVNDSNANEGSELLALKSELLLVREQTESDIKAMQEMLESSAKMNLALKKELLALQATAHQVADNEQPKKKKGLWK